MTIKLDDWLRRHVWIPYEDFKIKSTTDDDLVLLTIGQVSYSFLMAAISASKCSDGDDRVTVQNLLIEGCVLKVLFHHFLLLFSFVELCILASAIIDKERIFVVIFELFRSHGSKVYLFLPQVPKLDSSMIITCGKLIYIGQVLHAKHKIVEEPRGVFTNVGDILFLLFVLYEFSTIFLSAIFVLAG